MQHRPILAALLAAAAVALVGAQASSADRGPGQGHGKGHGGKLVFVQTDELAGNRIAVYRRGDDGGLTRTGMYPTGGLGGAALPGTESDLLASQGSLAYDRRHRLLIAVNAGSNTVSAFRVHDGALELESVLPSGGQFPASVGVHGDLAYVLNSGGAGIVQGFRISRDGLAPIAGSARSLGLANTTPPNFLMAPGQIGFTPDGRELIVTTKLSTNSYEVFQVGRDGRLSAAPVVTPAATPVPFAFTFGAADRLVAGEAGASSMTTYRLDAGGTLSDPRSQSDGQAALCWIQRVGGLYFVSNTASSTLSSFRIDAFGQPVLLRSVAATTNPGAIDVTSSGRYLYTETGTTGTVDEFRIGEDGTLAPIGSVGDLPPGIEGIAAS